MLSWLFLGSLFMLVVLYNVSETVREFVRSHVQERQQDDFLATVDDREAVPAAVEDRY